MLLETYVNYMKAIHDFYNRAHIANTAPKRGSQLKLLLIVSVTLLSSGCGMTQLKQREAALEQQQQILAEQQQQLAQEKQRLDTLKESLSQEKNRLEVLKKSLEPPASKPPEPPPQLLVGELEHVYLTPPDIKLVARIDTGAKTSSLNALDMVEFERDGKAHVRFSILNPQSGEKIEIVRRIIRHVKVKEHNGEAQSRPVVKIRVRLGNLDQPIKMTLTDRSEFKHQVLIGRNYLRDLVIVDVSQKFQTKLVINDK